MSAQQLGLSRRGTEVPASPIRRLAPYANAARADGVAIHYLNIGQPDIETPVEMIEAYRAYRGKVLAYGPSEGLEVLRSAIADYWRDWDVTISPDEVIVTTGGSEAILFALLATCDPGAEVLVPEPFYTNYLGFANVAGVRVVPVPASVENGFRLPAKAEFEKRITPQTRGIMFSNPGNPTGVVYTADEVALLGDLARDHDLYLYADEVYREFVYDGARFESVFHLEGLDDRVIVLDSVSKRYSACGARIGCLVTRNREILGSCLRYGQARLCPPTVDQIAAAAAYKAPKSYMENVLAEYGERREVLYEGLKSIPGVTAHKPAGAFYTVAKLPVADAEKFAIWMLTDFRVDGRTVMFAPTAGFYATEGSGLDEIRLAYVLKSDDLRDAVAILTAGLAAYPG